MMRIPTLLLLVVCTLVPLTTACQSDYRYKGNFVPHPADVSTNEPSVRTLASVIGVRNPDKGTGIPLSVETRLQLENRGESAVTFDPSTLRLTSGDLQQFGRPITDPKGTLEISPGDTGAVTAHFPFPEGVDDSQVDLKGLNLRWDVGDASQSASFTRRADPDYRERDRGPHFGVGIGVGTVID